MAKIDHSIYFQQQTPDIFGSAMRGYEMGTKISDLNRKRAEDSAIQEAFRANMTTGPDGSPQFNRGGFTAQLAQNKSVSPQAAMAFQDQYDQQRQQQQAIQRQYQLDQQAEAYRQAQLGVSKGGLDVQKMNAQTQRMKAEADIRAAQQRAAGGGEIKSNQAMAAGFGRRIEQAETAMKRLTQSGYDAASPSAGIGRSMPNILRSKESQMQEQAERNFVNAVLRRESGAAIAASEFESAEMQYFPRVGDSPEVLAQKAANRQQAMEMFKAEAGNAWDRIPLVLPAGQGRSASESPKHGDVIDGYVFLGGDPADRSRWMKAGR